MKIQKEGQWGSLTNQGRLHRGSDPGAEAGGRRNSSGGKEAWDTEGAENHFPMLILLTLTASITPTPCSKAFAGQLPMADLVFVVHKLLDHSGQAPHGLHLPCWSWPAFMESLLAGVG